MRGRRQTSVGVADLAWYAADPEGFCRHRGGVRSRKAVRVGRRGHHQAGISPLKRFVRRLMALLAIVVAIVVLWLLLGSDVQAGDVISRIEAGEFDVWLWGALAAVVALFLVNLIRNALGSQGHLVRLFEVPGSLELIATDLGGKAGMGLRAGRLIGKPDAIFGDRRRRRVIIGEKKSRRARGKARWSEWYQLMLYMGMARTHWRNAEVSGRLLYRDGVVHVSFDEALYGRLLDLIPEFIEARKRWRAPDPRPLHAR